MYANRIRNWNVPRAPKPAPTKPSVKVPAGFVVAPIVLMNPHAGWQLQLYQAAYQRARAAAEVPRHYRRFFSVWN